MAEELASIRQKGGGGGSGTEYMVKTFYGVYTHSPGAGYKNISAYVVNDGLTSNPSDSYVGFLAKEKVTLSAYGSAGDRFRFELYDSTDTKIRDLYDAVIPTSKATAFSVDIDVEAGYYIRLYRVTTPNNPNVYVTIYGYFSGMKEQ